MPIYEYVRPANGYRLEGGSVLQMDPAGAGRPDRRRIAVRHSGRRVCLGLIGNAPGAARLSPRPAVGGVF